MKGWKEKNIIQKIKGIKIGKGTIALTVCFLYFVFLYLIGTKVPLRYDPEHMAVETVEAAIVPVNNEYISASWTPLDELDFDGVRAVEAGEYKTMDLVQISYKEIANVKLRSTGRDIQRNGETVRIVYFSYVKRMWNKLFDGLINWRYSGSATGGIIYGDNCDTLDYTPQKDIEIYYLPRVDFDEIDMLPDEEYEAFTESATLIWDGRI